MDINIDEISSIMADPPEDADFDALMAEMVDYKFGNAQ